MPHFPPQWGPKVAYNILPSSVLSSQQLFWESITGPKSPHELPWQRKDLGLVQYSNHYTVVSHSSLQWIQLLSSVWFQFMLCIVTSQLSWNLVYMFTGDAVKIYYATSDKHIITTCIDDSKLSSRMMQYDSTAMLWLSALSLFLVSPRSPSTWTVWIHWRDPRNWWILV